MSDFDKLNLLVWFLYPAYLAFTAGLKRLVGQIKISLLLKIQLKQNLILYLNNV
jgi:hypothetical protein